MSRCHFLRSATVAIGLVLVLAATTAGAFQPNDVARDYEIRLPEYDSFAKDYAGVIAARQAEETLARRYGGQWNVQTWNAQTRTPRWVYGDAVSMTAGVRGADHLAQLAERVLVDNYDVLRADPSSVRLVRTPHAMGKWVARYQQVWNGYEVWQAGARLVFSDTGNLMLMGSTFHEITDLDPTPALSAGAAADIAAGDLPFDPAIDRVESGAELLVLPVPRSATEVEYHLVWRVRVHTARPLGEWVTHVDAHDGSILWRYNDIHFDYLGDTNMPVEPHTYCDGTIQSAIPYLNINVSGLGQTTSDATGAWTVAGTGGDRAVTAAMQGPWVRVYNYNGTDAAFNGTASENVPLTLEFNDLNSRADERDVFDAISRIHDFFEIFDPGYYYSNASIDAYVNRTDGYCPGNAWWNGTINFCAGSSTYGNTGEMQQVVEHEFGHGIQDHLMGGWQGDQGLGEGNGDIIGNLLTQDPVIGRGFYVGNCVSGIRNSLNSLSYPGDVVGQEIHYAGQVIAGFNWDAMVLMQALYGEDQGTILTAERWHFGRMLLQPSTQPDQVVSMFVADDDNGDLADGTPNHAILEEAAQNHGFDDFVPEILVGAFVYHDNIPYQTRTEGTYEVACEAVSLGGGEIVPGSVMLYYSVDEGPYAQVAMTPGAGPDEFVAAMPAQADGSTVEYYIAATNDLGDDGFSPRAHENDPLAVHYLQVGTAFPDEMEFETAWSVGAPDDNASTGVWERGDPQGTDYNGNIVQMEDDHTPAPGVSCWVTGLYGSEAGTNDVDGGKTTLFSPLFDLTGGTDITIGYWRWYTNDEGNAPGQDYWRVDVTNDGGETWTSVENTNVSNEAWQQVTFALADLVPEPAGLVQLRFIAEDAPDGSLVEAGVDDFTLVGTFDVTAVDDQPGLELVFDLSQNHPNPFNPQTTVKFSLDTAGPASLKVFDTRGRLVKVLVSEALTAGPHTAVWRGDDRQGRPVASGVYFYRLEADGRQLSKRMLLVK